MREEDKEDHYHHQTKSKSKAKKMPLLLLLSSIKPEKWVLFYLKKEAVNAILNTSSKTVSAIFSASNKSTGIILLSYFPNSHSNIPQQGDPYCYIACQ